ncbi:hypothetical protein C9439_01390 [archaeon SCG-AAA382B04]|nr:hypothetical protein C9439_01390 [archaeon SCG-AAA382B04]
MNEEEAIRKRKSTRKYKDTEVAPSIIEEVKKCFSDSETIFGSKIKLDIKKRQEIDGIIKGIVGDYGKVVSPYYLIFSTKGEKKTLIDLGYIGQKLVLQLTQKKLGTCWIGKFGDKQKFKERLDLSDECIPQAFIAFGEAKGNPFREKEPNRKPLDQLIINKDHNSKFEKILELVRFAPSAINGQPWRFELKKDKINFYLTKKGLVKKVLTKIANIGTLNYIDMGICLRYAKIGAKIYSKEMTFEKSDKDSMNNLEDIVSLKEK